MTTERPRLSPLRQLLVNAQLVEARPPVQGMTALGIEQADKRLSLAWVQVG